MGHAALSMTDQIKVAAGRSSPGPRSKAPRRRPKPSLTQAMQEVARHERSPPATRAGRRGILLYFDQHVADAIRRLASDYDATNQDLGEMAFKFLFEKFGEPWPA